MDWKNFEQEIAALSHKIDAPFDIIVGVVRGGVVPARMLSSRLGVKKMYCISVEKDGNERKVVTEINEDIDGKKILLIEDMLETGQSLVVAKKYLENKGAHVATGCLYTMPISVVHPDYSLGEVEAVVKFPWE